MAQVGARIPPGQVWFMLDVDLSENLIFNDGKNQCLTQTPKFPWVYQFLSKSDTPRFDGLSMFTMIFPMTRAII
jgi:hypothetical protein